MLSLSWGSCDRKEAVVEVFVILLLPLGLFVIRPVSPRAVQLGQFKLFRGIQVIKLPPKSLDLLPISLSPVSTVPIIQLYLLGNPFSLSVVFFLFHT